VSTSDENQRESDATSANRAGMPDDAERAPSARIVAGNLKRAVFAGKTAFGTAAPSSPAPAFKTVAGTIQIGRYCDFLTG